MPSLEIVAYPTEHCQSIIEIIEEDKKTIEV